MSMNQAGRLAVAVIVAATLATFTWGCQTAPITGRNQLILVSQGEMMQLSDQQYSQVLQEERVLSSGPEVEQVNRVGQRIAAATEDYVRQNNLDVQFAWEFNVIADDQQVNAWAMPGGKIAFYTGIFPYCRDDNGVAVVMAHEIGHALAQHSAERMSQTLMAQMAIGSVAQAMDSQPERTRQIFMAAAGLGAQYGVLLPFSRQQEYEADHIGAVLMAMAGYDPREAVPFWQRMMSSGGARPPEWMSTHPASENRISRLRDVAVPAAMKHYRANSGAALPAIGAPTPLAGVRGSSPAGAK